MLSLLVSDAEATLLQQLTPAAPILAAGALAALLPSHAARKAVMLLAPFLALGLWVQAAFGQYGVFEVAGFELVTFRFDGLSRVFGLVFIIACFLNGLYALHERSRLQDTAALIYAGAGLGAVFAGDLVTLFMFWELAAISSVFLIWARGGTASTNAGLRYLAIHVGSGVLLLSGAVFHYVAEGSMAFDTLDPRTTGGALIFLAFGIKCAFPFLHNWLQDAYPKATATGAVVLSAFTTKMAIYALARGYAGFEPLIYIGAAMTIFPVFFAVIENDLRRVLSFSINNQLGFMVCGVGLAGAGVVGGELALNGVAAHAFADVIFKGLLFMSMGAVMHRLGTTKATELGGLYKSMPFTALFCMIGAASISALPLFSAFVTKSLILAAAAEQGRWLVWLMLLFASAGVLEHAGIKIPFFAFFAHDSGKRPAEAPWNMLWAMFIAAFLCVYIGVRPDVLYGLLPFEIDYVPYTLDHVITQSQLVLAATFAFVLLYRYGLYPPERRVTILDFDWIYRRAGAGLVGWLAAVAGVVARGAQTTLGAASRAIDKRLHAVFSPAGALSRATPSGVLAVWTVLLLGAAIVVAYLAPL
jgi:multicomponent Na+:H+ antiporter subunit D